MDGAKHILVVDDDIEIRRLLSDFLARNGYRVTVAPNGAAMMQTLGIARIDLVILDIMMPGEDGLWLCRRLRADGTMPIIMLTAVGGEADRIAGLEMGADDYLPKPFIHSSCSPGFVRCCGGRPCQFRVRQPAPVACSSLPAGVSM